MNLKVVPFSQIDDDKWNRFILSNSMGWAYFLKEVIAFHRNRAYKNKSFAIVDEDNQDEILFVMQLHMFTRKKHWYSKTKYYLRSQWGYVVKDELTRKQSATLKSFFYDYIDKFYKELYVRDFVIEGQPPLCEMNITSRNEHINPFMKLYFSPGVRYTYVVDLSKSPEKLFADCEETTRQAIRKISNSNQYDIIESDGSDTDMQIYHALHIETYERTEAEKAIIDINYHKNIFNVLIPKHICRVFFLVNKETGEYKASVAILIYKNTAYYWWGNSKSDRDVGINKYLLFKTIQIIQKDFNNCGFFETGGAHPFLRRGKYKGLNDYKKSFGTELFPVFTGTYIN